MPNTCPQCSNFCDEGYQFCPSCGYPLAAVGGGHTDPLIGERLSGGYVILECIGGGGMGRVYRAEQTALGRSVAVKVIHSNLLTDESAAVRFITEARTASMLNHPNSVSVIDFGKHKSGQLYIVMEYLRGRDLGTVISEEGPLAMLRITDIILQVLAALSEAHYLGIVHRDLKPENIMLESLRTGTDFIKVVDFGLAKFLSHNSVASVTVPGMVCGTPEYMSPEQARGERADSRSDLYAVGIILYHMLANKLPFEGDTPRQILLKHVVASMPDPRDLAPQRQIPDAFIPVLEHAMQKDREKRYQNADSMTADLMKIKLQLQGKQAPQVSTTADEVSPSLLCPHCGEVVPVIQRFCGQCGARMSIPDDSAFNSSVSQSHYSERMRTRSERPESVLGFWGRQEEIKWLEQCRNDATNQLVCARVVGPPGIGKTSLLFRFFDVPSLSRDMVVSVGPDPWLASVAAFTVREIIQAMVDEQDFHQIEVLAPNHIKEAIRLLSSRSSIKNYTAEQVRRHISNALRWSLSLCIERHHPEVLVLCVGDLEQVDGPSRGAIADLAHQGFDKPLLLLADHREEWDPGWPDSCRVLSLQPLSLQMLDHLKKPIIEQIKQTYSDQMITPMCLEQVARYIDEGGTNPPAHVVDIIALRVARVDSHIRKVLQAMSVVGHELSAESLELLLGDHEPVQQRMDELVKRGLIISANGKSVVAHPLIRQVTEAITPVAVRKELHQKAYDLAIQNNSFREVRVMHALNSYTPYEALLILEQIAEDALRWGDTQGAIQAFEHCLEVIQQQFERTHDEQELDGIVILTRRLADILISNGNFDKALEYLYRVFSMQQLQSSHKAKLQFSLACLNHAAGQLVQAMPHITQAISLAYEAGDSDFAREIETTALGWQLG